MPIVIGALGTLTKELVKRLEELEIRGDGVSIKTAALWRSAKTMRVLETWEDLLSLSLQQTLVGKTQKNKIIRIMKQKLTIHKRIERVGDVLAVNHMISECIRLINIEYKLDPTGCERWSTGNYANDQNLDILTNDICTNQKLSQKIWLRKA